MKPGTIRQIDPAERSQLGKVMRRCFGFHARLFFDLGEQAFVFELDGEIAGGVTLSTFPIDAQRKGGLVKWLFIAPEAQGRGGAGRLLAEAVHWFEEQGCSDIFGCVEGNNTSSGNRFFQQGFTDISFSEQLASYGLRLPKVWLKTMHFGDTGFFLWRRVKGTSPASVKETAAPEDSATVPGLSPASGMVGFAVTVILHSLFAFIMQLRWGGSIATGQLWQVPLVILAIFGLRLAAMKAAARGTGIKLHYRVWESGMLLSGLIALVFGGFYTAPGSLYPPERSWSYREQLNKLGPVAFAGALSLLLAGWLFRLIDSSVSIHLSGSILQIADFAYFYIRVMLIFEVLLPFFPFTAFNGRRVLDWRRQSWAVLAMGTVLLWVAHLFL
ncbi:GNAT family N-acetyltransferase [Spirochaeta dissipatitropha]